MLFIAVLKGEFLQFLYLETPDFAHRKNKFLKKVSWLQIYSQACRKGNQQKQLERKY